jgi:hypothetical protein
LALTEQDEQLRRTQVKNTHGFATNISILGKRDLPPLLIGKDGSLSVNRAGSLTTPAFSTATASDLLVAFVSYDGPAGSSQTANVSGAGLTWTLLELSNTQSGTGEIWSARADGTLSGVTVNSLLGTGTGYHGSLTVIAFTNCAGTSVVGRSGAPSGAPHIILPGVIAGDWVFAVGNDWDHCESSSPIKRTGARPSKA